MQYPSTTKSSVPTEDQESFFPVLVILLPDRGFDPQKIPTLFTVPADTAVILLEYPRPNMEPNSFSTRLENALIGQAARRFSNIVREGMPLEKDQLYIVPSGLYPEIRDGRFILLHRPLRDGDTYLPDFILAAFAAIFGSRLSVVLSGQTGLLGANVVRKEGGRVYFLEDAEYRPPLAAVSIIDGMVSLARLTETLASADRPRTQPSPTGIVASSRAPFALRANLCKLLQQEVFPLLLKDRSGHGPIRVWIAADPDGLMAYTTAIGLMEYLNQRKITTRVQLFATGLDRREVQRARIGRFSAEAMAPICSSWCDEYFRRRDDGLYQISRSLQHSCIFATHHFVADPPYSHCDLVICANPLNLLTDGQRKKVFSGYHYALNPGGCLLMLDHSASMGLALSGYFTSVDTVPGVYIRRQDNMPETQAQQPRMITDAEKEAEKIMLSGHVPAAMLVDEELRVVRFYGVVSPYLRRNQDRPSLHLLKIVRDELVFELSDLLAKVAKTRRAATADGIYLADESKPEVQLEVSPVTGATGNHKLVFIREKEAGPDSRQIKVRTTDNARDRRIKALEKQVQRLRYQLQTAHHLFRQNQQHLQEMNEEMLASNEDLQSVNEEFHSINEDLQIRNKDLELQARRNRSVISAIHRPLVVIMDSGMVHIANRAFLELFGLHRKAIEGHPWTTAAGSMFNLPELRERLQSMAAVDVVDFELKFSVPGMDEKTLAFSANRIRGEAGAGGGILLMMEDVTDRRRTERFKDEFIGIASHELKTPATSIKAYTQLLRRELNGSGDKEPAKLAEHLSQQVDRLTDLAKDLLDISKASQGQLNLKRNFFDPDQFIAEVVEDMQPTTTGKLLLAEMQNLPQIWADRERLRQVLVNLLSNAIKYSPGGTDIHIRCTVVKKNIQFSVQDFGIGMTTSTLQNLFTRYYRSDDPASARLPGMGLGLYIAAEIVRRHGGSIMVSSEKDKGSTFTVEIPIDRKED